MLLEGKDLNYNNMIPGNSFYCPVNIIRTFLEDNPSFTASEVLVTVAQNAAYSTIPVKVHNFKNSKSKKDCYYIKLHELFKWLKTLETSSISVEESKIEVKEIAKAKEYLYVQYISRRNNLTKWLENDANISVNLSEHLVIESFSDKYAIVKVLGKGIFTSEELPFTVFKRKIISKVEN